MENYVKYLARHSRGETRLNPYQESLYTLNELTEESKQSPLVTKVCKMQCKEALVKKMACAECGLLPHPSKLYFCDDGHIFCSICAEDRGLKHDFNCRVEKPPITKSKATPNAESADTDEEGPDHFPVCYKKLRHCPPDPMYMSMWNNAIWACPNRAKGCKEELLSDDFAGHVKKCNLKFKKEKENRSTKPSELKCPLNGCERCFDKMLILEHLVVDHELEIIEGSTGKTSGYSARVGIPYVTIDGKKPVYAMIHGVQEFFLLGVEPVISQPGNEDYLACWIRELHNFGKDENGEKPRFSYSFSINKAIDHDEMKVQYSNAKMWEWENSIGEIITARDCMLVPCSLLKIYFLKEIKQIVTTDSYPRFEDKEEFEGETTYFVQLLSQIQRAKSKDSGQYDGGATDDKDNDDDAPKSMADLIERMDIGD